MKFYIIYSEVVGEKQKNIYSDPQNYVYGGKFFLSRPLLQWKKKVENFGKIYSS